MQRASRGMTARISTRTATGGKGNGPPQYVCSGYLRHTHMAGNTQPDARRQLRQVELQQCQPCLPFLSKDFQSKFPDIFSRIFFLYFHVVLFFQILKCEAFQIFCPLLNFQTWEMFPFFPAFPVFLRNEGKLVKKKVTR